MLPLTELLKATALVLAPLHAVWLPGIPATGIGLAVIVNVLGVPVQVFASAVTEIVATTGAFVVFTALNVVILPLPLPPSPIEVVLFVHVKVLPPTRLAKFMDPELAPVTNG